MATCKRCNGRAFISAVIHPSRPTRLGNGCGDYRVFRCPDCKGTGEAPETDDGRGVLGDYCEIGNQCGRLGCPECQQ